jgi:hypothetical protein
MAIILPGSTKSVFESPPFLKGDLGDYQELIIIPPAPLYKRG